MNRRVLLRHLARHGCTLKREGGSNSIWKNQKTGKATSVPRHWEIPDHIARLICRQLGVQLPGS